MALGGGIGQGFDSDAADADCGAAEIVGDVVILGDGAGCHCGAIALDCDECIFTTNSCGDREGLPTIGMRRGECGDLGFPGIVRRGIDRDFFERGKDVGFDAFHAIEQ